MPHTLSTQIPLAYSLLSAGPAVSIDEGYALLDINRLITGDREGVVLAFVVTGDSMREDIHPGYIVFVDTTLAPRNGDTVAVNINGDNCVKIFEQERHKFYLVPKNGEYPSREITHSDSVHVLGVVTYHLAVY